MSSLVPVDTFSLVPAATDLAAQIAATEFAPAGLRGKPAAVMAAMLTGHELGIGPMQALSEIAVINGRPCMSAKLMRGLVQRAGHEIWFHEKTNTKVTIKARRSEWPEDRVATVTWTMDDAQKAGLAGGQNYRKYPRQMLGARATGEICRDNFADVLGGISYTPEEVNDIEGVDEGLDLDPRDAVDEPSGQTRKAKRAPARKSTAAKKAAPARPAGPIAVADLPPLPGEDGFDGDPAPAEGDEDIVDAEVIEDPPVDPDDAPATLLEAVKAAGVTQAKALKRARELAAAMEADLPGGLDEVTGEVLTALCDDLGVALPSSAGAGATEGRNKKMWAMAAEAWPDESDEERDECRRTLIGVVSARRTESSKDLTAAEWDALFDALDQITKGTQVLHLRANGEWELRRQTGRRSA